MKSNSAAFQHKRFSLTSIAMNDRRRFVFALFLGLIVNLLILAAGELYLHVFDNSLPEEIKTPFALNVVLKNPIRENDLSPQSYENQKNIPLPLQSQTEQSEMLMDEEERLSHFANEIPQVSSDAESTAIAAVNVSEIETDSGSPEKTIFSESAVSPEIIQGGSFIEASEYSAESEQNKLYETIYALIEKEKQYPVLARRRNIEGQVGLAITISIAGNLEDCTISISSGSPILDNAAMNLMKKIFPLNIGLHSETTITITIRYSLND